MGARLVVKMTIAMNDGVEIGELAGKLRSSHKPDLCLHRFLLTPRDHDFVAEGLAELKGEES